jgi:hypothetical protein
MRWSRLNRLLPKRISQRQVVIGTVDPKSLTFPMSLMIAALDKPALKGP